MSYSHLESFPPKLPGRDYLYQPFTTEEWNASSFATEENLQWFRDARYGMFIHFGLSTYQNGDLSWDICHTRKAPDFGNGPFADEEWTSWGNHFELEKFDADEYVDLAKRAGFKYVVVVAKHHDGFHMWDTEQSDFKITNTPFGRDFVKEIIEACQKASMPVGLYYSQRDWYHPDYMPVDPEKIERQTSVNWTLKEGIESPVGNEHWKYIAYQENVVRELCTRYGKLDIFWWDALWWGGMFTADMWDAEKVNRLVRELQPNIIINNRCSIPGDFDTPEKRLGAFQNWRPWESCVCLTDSWSYSGTPVKPLKDLVAMLTMTICGDGNLLMSWGPHWDGEFDKAEVEALLEMGDWLGKHEDAIYGTRGGPWKPGTWGGSVYRDKSIYLHIISIVGNKLELPKLPQTKIEKATIFNSEAELEIRETENSIVIVIPDEFKCSPSLILNLQVDRLVKQIKPLDSAPPSPFMDICAYGYKYDGDVSITHGSTINNREPWVLLDFDKVIKLTALVLDLNKVADSQEIVLLTSKDGNDWTDWGKVNTSRCEIEITCYESGAWIPGNDVRFVKLQSKLDISTPITLNDVTCFSR